MYIPAPFKVADATQMYDLMRRRPFATLVSSGGAGLLATHLPTVLKLDQSAHGTIECHVARSNAHWKEFSEARDALLIYHGADSYIRPGWYPSKVEHGKVVPTWNYETVHAHGRAECIDDRAWLARHVAELTAQQEHGQDTPWAPNDAPESYMDAMLRGIVGIRFEIARLEGARKMSQNRNAADSAGAARGLRERGERDDGEVADLIDRFAKSSSS